MSDSQSVIEVNHLCKTVDGPGGQLTILEDINFTVSAAESMAIVGVSGSGKSTLLGLMAGLDVPSSGHVMMQNKNLSEMDEDSRAAYRKGRVGFVFQSFQLLQNLDALENVMMPLELAEDDQAVDKARENLKLVGLENRTRHYPNQLSGGEQQRVAIARAFASEPSILFADEPTGNLDSATADKTIDLLFDINSRKKTTLILVTHDIKLAEHCDRTLTLAAGRLVDLK